MSDPFAGAASGLSGPATRHFAISPSNSADIAIRPRALVFQTDGDAVVRDEAGTEFFRRSQADRQLALR